MVINQLKRWPLAAVTFGKLSLDAMQQMEREGSKRTSPRALNGLWHRASIVQPPGREGPGPSPGQALRNPFYVVNDTNNSVFFQWLIYLLNLEQPRGAPAASPPFPQGPDYDLVLTLRFPYPRLVRRPETRRCPSPRRS